MASRGDSFKADAEKALNKTSIFSFLSSGTQKYEDAADLFTKAGNAYKLSNQFEDAGNVFVRASKCHKQADSANDAALSLVEAANCFKKSNPVNAIKAFTEAIEIYNDSGRFGQSARYYKEIAEICEADNNSAGAVGNYEQAATMFSNDNKKSNANQCLLKVATIASADGNLIKAAEIFETIGRESLESRLGQYSAKGYLFQSALCHMAAGDAVATRNKLEVFKNADYTFPSSRECQLIEKLLEAIDNFNSDDYAQACADFDRISPLDPWKTSMLLRAKSFITAAAGEEGEVDLT